jgi:multidrug resistance protein, MATE family
LRDAARHFGDPALGVACSGYASAINQWLILAGLALCTRLIPRLGMLRVLRSAFAASGSEKGKILRLGLPIGGIMGIQIGVFLVAVILMGLLGAAAPGVHQLVLNCAGITFMVPLGLSQAAMVRVAYELGAGREHAARCAGFAALGLGVGFMSAMAVVLWTLPQTIIGVYIDIADPGNSGLIGIGRHLIAIAAIFQIFDGMQVIATGALRGYRDTFVPMLPAAGGYWGAGFIGGWLLAFPLGYGAVGPVVGSCPWARGRCDPVDSTSLSDRATAYPGSGGSRIAVARGPDNTDSMKAPRHGH